MFDVRCSMCDVDWSGRPCGPAAYPSHVAHRGFTLIEIVLVLLLITVALAMVAPSLQGWSRGGRLRDAADQFQSATLWAQSQAAADSVGYYLAVDSTGKSYQVSPDSQAASTDDSTVTPTQKFTLADHLTIQLVKVDNSGGSDIRFSPTGSTTPAQVRITADWDESIDIACDSSISIFKRVKEER